MGIIYLWIKYGKKKNVEKKVDNIIKGSKKREDKST